MTSPAAKTPAFHRLLKNVDDLIRFEQEISGPRLYAAHVTLLGRGLFSGTVEEARALIEAGPVQMELAQQLLVRIRSGLQPASLDLIANVAGLLVDLCTTARRTDEELFIRTATMQISSEKPSRIALLSTIQRSALTFKWLPAVGELLAVVRERQEDWVRAEKLLGALPNRFPVAKRHFDGLVQRLYSPAVTAERAAELAAVLKRRGPA